MSLAWKKFYNLGPAQGFSGGGKGDGIGLQLNRGVSHYQILPVSRDIRWPVQQLDYFRYIKQHLLTIELLYIGYNFKEIKKRQLLIEESDKTACHYGHLWLHLYTVFILCWPKLHPVLSSMSAHGPFENNKILRTCL